MSKIILFYGWNNHKNSPKQAFVYGTKTYINGFKAFSNEQDAKNHYLESKKQAFERLEKDAEEMQTILASVKAKGIEFDSWVNCLDDQGLSYGLCVSCTVNGFYFTKKLGD